MSSELKPIGETLATMGEKHFSRQQAASSERSARLSTAVACVRRLLGLYPDHGRVDPQAFTEVMIELFAGYPIEVQRRAVAATGIPGRYKFLPAIAEAKAVLDAIEDPVGAPDAGEFYRHMRATKGPAYGRIEWATAAELEARANNVLKIEASHD